MTEQNTTIFVAMGGDQLITDGDQVVSFNNPLDALIFAEEAFCDIAVFEYDHHISNDDLRTLIRNERNIPAETAMPFFGL